MILYCFITHNSAIEQDLEYIEGCMHDLDYIHYRVFYGGKDKNLGSTTINIDCDDTYEGLPNKIYRMCKYITHNDLIKDYSHFCKLDADIRFKKLLPVLDHDYYGYVCKDINPPEYRRCYHYGKCSQNSDWNTKKYAGAFVEYCAGGWCYVLSRAALRCISSSPNDPNHDIYEDLYVGQQLLKCNIKPFHYDTTRLFDGWRN